MHALWTLVLVCCFLFLSYVPVGSAATWNDVALANLNSDANLLPLADGVRSIELSPAGIQVIDLIYRWGGVEGLSIAFALIQTLTLVLMSIAIFRVSGTLTLAIVTPPLLAAALFFEFDGLSRETFGLLMFSVQLLLLTEWGDGKTGIVNWSNVNLSRWLLVAVLFVVWTNTHASFVIGLTVLLAYALCQFWEVRGAILNDKEFRSRVWLFELALFATLLTPNGFILWQSALWWPDNPFVNQLGGWQPTLLTSWQGIVIAGFWTIWIVCSRYTERISTFSAISAFILTVLCAMSSRCLVWFVPMMLFSLAELASRREHNKNRMMQYVFDRLNQPLRFVFSLLALLFIWIGLSFSPTGGKLLGSDSRAVEQTIGRTLPLAATTYLEQSKDCGLTWCPAHWSDWMQTRTGRPMFTNANLYRLPQQVITDYRHIFAGHPNWHKLADQYAVSTIVLDKRKQEDLFRQVRIRRKDWNIAFEDSVAVIARRNFK